LESHQLKPNHAVPLPDAHGVAHPGCPNRNRSGISLSLTAALLAVAACSEVNVTAVDIAELEIEPVSLELVIGDTAQLVANARDANGNTLRGRTVTWSTSNPTVAAVMQDGRVIAVGSGEATITAASNGVADEATVKINGAAVIGVEPGSAELRMTEGGALPGAWTLAVRNNGSGTLDGLSASIAYAQGERSGWLDVSLADVRAPTTLLVRITNAGFPVGAYHATVTLASTAPRTGTRDVPVLLEVQPPLPRIVLGTHQVKFSAIEGGPDPAEQNIIVSNGGGGTLSGLGTSITYSAGQPADWLTASLSPSTAPSTLKLVARTGSLPAGSYSATVNVISAQAGNSPQTVAVSFDVGAPSSSIGLSSTALAFLAIAGGANPPAQTVNVTNTGGGTLSGLATAVRYDAGASGWLTTTLSSGTAPSTLTLNAVTGSLAAGTYTAFVDVSAPGASNSPRSIAVAFTVNSPSVPPSIALSATTASFSATAGGGDPAAQTIDITNSGGGTLSGLAAAVTYASGQTGGWLTATLSATSAPATLTLQSVTGSLAAGTYSATVDITAPNAPNSPQSIAVTFTVNPPVPAAAISLNPITATFNATAGGGNPASQNVDVTNTGGGTLDQLAVSVTYGSGQPTGWLTATLNATTAPTTITLQPATGTLAAGAYTATVEVTSPVASNSPQTVAVTFTVAAAPPPAAIALAPAIGSFAATAGGPDPGVQTVSITNSGAGSLTDLVLNLTYAAGQPGGWLTATLATTTAPTSLSLQATTGNLSAGSYEATVAVSSIVASNSPQNLNVTLTLTASSPSAPTNLGAVLKGRTDIELEWRDNSNNEQSFVVQRMVFPFTQWVSVVTLSQNTQKYTDKGLSAGAYFYRVQACNSAGCAISNTVFILR
jgi:hypothetical protein